MQTRIFQRHGHMPGELREKILVFRREARTGSLVQQLDYADHFSTVMPNRHSQKRTSAVVEALVEAGLEELQLVRVIDADGLAGFGDPSGDALAPGNTNFLMIESEGNDRPQFLVFVIHQEDAAAIGFYLLSRDLQDQLKQLGEIQGRVQQTSCLKEQRKLCDLFLLLLGGENV